MSHSLFIQNNVILDMLLDAKADISQLKRDIKH